MIQKLMEAHCYLLGKKAIKGVSVIIRQVRKEPPECLGKILLRKIRTQWRWNKVWG